MGGNLSRFVHRIELPSGRSVLFHALTQEYMWLDDAAEVTECVKKHKPQFVCDAEADNRLLELFREELEQPYVNTAYFFLTKNCNLACKYCFECQSVVENTPDGSMTFGTFDKALCFFERLIKSDVEQYELTRRFSLIFYGGEPFYNKKTLYYAIERVEAEMAAGRLPAGRVKMLVVTNGTLLTEKDVEFLKRHEITVTFSLDGDRESSVNRVFADGKTPTWERASETFVKCKEAGVDLNVACTLTPETIARQRAVTDYFVNGIGATTVGFNVILDNDIINLGDGESYDDEAAKFVVSSWRVLSAANVRENRVARRLQAFHPTEGDVSREEFEGGVHASCRFDCNAAGGRQIAVAPDGSVGICHEHIMDRKHFVTSVDDDSFLPSESPVYADWARRTPLFMEKCYDCVAIGVCGGGCVINSERRHGDIHVPDPRFCKQTLRIFHEILIPLIEQ